MKKQIFITSITTAVAFTLGACKDNKDSVKAPESASSATYPLEVCVVGGEQLGSMGKPFVIDYKGTEVRFCCKECEGEFHKDPDKYLTMLKSGKVE